MTTSKKILVIVLAVLLLRLLAVKIMDAGDNVIKLSAADAERCWVYHEKIDELTLRQERNRTRAFSDPTSSDAQLKLSKVGAEFETFAETEVIPFINEMRGKYSASLGEYKFDMVRARFVRTRWAEGD